jgi:hypothetical protein
VGGDALPHDPGSQYGYPLDPDAHGPSSLGLAAPGRSRLLPDDRAFVTETLCVRSKS